MLLAMASADPVQVARSDATITARMRGLWDAQVTWTRLYVVSALGNLPDTAFARARLFRCPEDMGRVVEAYYGRSHAENFARALRRHLTTLTTFIDATKAGDAAAIDAGRQRLRVDAESTAIDLGKINPAWSAASFRELLDLYLQLTDREVTLRARGEYGADIENFGDLHELGVRVAEVIARDIINQFRPGFAPAGR